MSIRSMPSNKKYRENYDRVFRGITHIKPSWTPVFTDDDGNEIKPRRIEDRQPFDTIVGEK
jgi:cell wall assembly regulator SMI1